MPLILDSAAPVIHSPNQTTQDGDMHALHLVNASSSPPRPHRTQSTTAILHHPLRLPPTVPEEGPAYTTQDHIPVSGALKRARTSAGIPKLQVATERIAEEDASWWTEEIHKRREIRRRWKEAEDENIVIIGNKIDTNHPNYVTAYNMLTGLRVAVFSSLLFSALMSRYRVSVLKSIGS